MIALYLAPVYLLVNGYLLFRILKWAGICAPVFRKRPARIVVSSVYAFFVFSIPIAFVMPAGQARRIMKLISNDWLGVLLYLVMAVIICEIIRLVLCLVQRKSIRKIHSSKFFAAVGAVCAVVVIVFSIWGIVNARMIRVTPYEVAVDKLAGDLDSLHVVLIADLHLGYNIGITHMTKMVELINEQDADLVVIAGDIFDNEYEALENPKELAEILNGIEAKYGVYACYGNHDIQEPILAGFTFGGEDGKSSSQEMDQFMEKSDIRLLKDEAVLIDDSFYLYGRPDYERPGLGDAERKTPEEITAELDLAKPVIVIEHEPRELAELADAGVDVDLCGHTHDGQMFPGNLTIDLAWKNAYGYLKKDQMHNIVTSGVGLFGPNMRVGTRAEICPITIHFNYSE